jgi:hypothetical protein
MSRSWIAGAFGLCLMAYVFCALAAEENAPTESRAKSSDQGYVGDEHADEGEIELTAGYDKTAMNGFFIRSEDQSFRLNIGAYTQFRYDVNWRDAPAGQDDFTSDFSIRRTRIFFEGNYTPEFNYHHPDADR